MSGKAKTNKPTKKNAPTVEEQYQKMDPHEHVLALPDTYIGGIEEDVQKMWIYNEDTKKLHFKPTKYNPGVYKIFDEVIVNARDHTIRDTTARLIKVDINDETGEITCFNDGQNGIPIVVHKEHNVYLPEMLFGNLLTSGNYHQKGKIVGGKNGLGGTLANIFSSSFYIEVVDHKRKLKYCQHFSNNMYTKEKPKIKDCNDKRSYVLFKFVPDFKRFGIDGLNDDMISLLKKRVYDVAACTDNRVKVYLDGEQLKINSFHDYIGYFYEGEPPSEPIYEEVESEFTIDRKKTKIVTWKVAAIFDPNSGFRHISYVNGICTFHGGKHVDHVLDKVLSGIAEKIKAKHKDLVIKNSQIKDNLTFFIDSVIIDPSFSSQIKDYLTNKVASFGSRYEVSDEFIKNLCKTGIMDEVADLAKFRAEKALVKTDGKKTKNVKGILKLKDAKWAGTRKSKYCTLILTEGDSAKGFAMSGLDVIENGHERYGVFPLKGKLLNVREATVKQLTNNEEIKNIKQIMGLKQNKTYKDISQLRYGRVLILTDQDSVTGDTPLLLKNNDNNIDIKTIDTLTDNWKISPNGKEYSNSTLQIWTDNGWTKIVKVIRHKVQKRIYRVLTHTGVVDVTEDHSLITDNNQEIAPKKCNIGDKLLHSFPKFEDSKNELSNTTITEEEAYDMGFFWADGSVKTKEIDEKYRNLFYDKDKKKKIPIEILNSPLNVKELFFKGYYDGDGCKYSLDKNGSRFFDIDGKIGAHSMYYLCKSIGYDVSINIKESNLKVYTLTITKDHQQFDPYKIQKIIDLGKTEQYVYDLETENHHFQAGVGQMIVHNTDGSHIKGLVINFIHYFWPSLILHDGFVTSMATPIVKGWKKTDTKKKNVKIFYTMTEYSNWKDSLNNPSQWKTKYYKGLGTSTKEEAKECFIDFEKKIISYNWNKDEKEQLIDSDSGNSPLDIDSEDSNDVEEIDNQNTDEDELIDKTNPSHQAITKAFAKNRTNDRKTWLMNYNKDDIIENNVHTIFIDEFIDRDLIHFSNYDNLRSIPSMNDGQKPSQRKIIFGAFKKNILKDEIKVSQLSGSISETSAYHHGEASLQGAIINMAQNYVGSNNINLLFPIGNFGDRMEGGKNSASPRYIYTQLNALTPLIFRNEDEIIYEYVNDDGQIVEPVTYAPIIPLVLVNGTHGIGTGFSTSVPCHNPMETINNLKKIMKDNTFNYMYPWYKGFKGVIEKLNNTTFRSVGIYEIVNNNTIHITELPIGMWTENYQNFLETLVMDDPKKPKNGQILKEYFSKSSDDNVDIEVTFLPGVLQQLIKKNDIKRVMKLTKNINVSNMYLYGSDKVIRKYNSIEEILRDFYKYRLGMYVKRKAAYLKVLENEVDLIKWKVKFLEYIIDGKIIVYSFQKPISKSKVIDKLVELKFPKLSTKVNAEESSKTYSYITSISLFSLTEEELEKLRKELEMKNAEYETYLNTSPEQLWLNELDEFEKMYKVWLKEEMSDDNNNKKKSKGKGKSKSKSKSKGKTKTTVKAA